MDHEYIIVKEASVYVLDLLTKELPPTILFHNVQHTEQVAAATMELAFYAGLSLEDANIVQIAAWFHDTGYCYQYNGHEDASIAIASTFLSQQGCNDIFIEMVIECIAATRSPQKPRSLSQQILCDADLFHFSRYDYQEYAMRLKEELARNLNKMYTNTEWNELNLQFLKSHKYFTKHANFMWQNRKQRNIENIIKAI